jgi:ABC-type transport system involved in multi-copper enzyme maturation permease subunit
MSAVAPTVPKLETPGRVTFAGVLRSEWTKFRSVRSTLWCVGITILLSILIPILVAIINRTHWAQMSPGEQANRHPLDIAFVGIFIAQLVIAVLGVLLISAEYSTGSIRSTMTAVPKRLPVLWAKLLDYSVFTMALMVPAVLISFFSTQAIFDTIPQLQVSFSAPGIARCVLMGAVYVTMVGIFALALGAIVRNTAGGIATFAGLFFVIPPLMNLLPSNWNNAISQYLPPNAGTQIFALKHASHTLTPLAGGLVFAGYCAVAIAIAAVLLRRRDV